METISQETRMISEKEFQHVAKDAQILGNETKEEIKNRYMGSDTRPWIVAYSGGKDSTLLTQLVFEAIKDRLAQIKSASELKPMKVKCTSEKCGHEYEQPFTLDMSNFFV